MSDLIAAVITVSDRSSRGEREDLTGPALKELLTSSGWTVAKYLIIPDEIQEIEQQLRNLCSQEKISVIFTAGGTGFSPRDVTPEATRRVIEKEAPGLVIAMLGESLKKTPHAMLSRQIAGIAGSTIIINLPGSPKAAIENIQVILPALPHAIKLLHADPDSESGHRF